jgi:H+/gluconate symporter-like permease
MPILLVIPVAIIFYLIGKWLKESVKRDEEKEKMKVPTISVQKNESANKQTLTFIFDIILFILIAAVGLYIAISFVTDLGSGHSSRCSGATEKECEAIEAVEGSR